MQTYDVTLTSTMPMLMHNDDIEWADQLEEWKKVPSNKALSRAGDDRAPAWRWIGSLYHDGQNLIIPTENIMRALMEGGSMVMTGSGKKTFKSQSQSGIMPRAVGWPLLIGGAMVPVAPITALMTETNFAAHKEAVAGMGFSLFVKRARIGTAKHIRVRPRFETWSATGELVIIDSQISAEVLESILACAGTYKGLGDWRPGSKTPGSFGTFEAKITAQKR